MSYTLIQNVKGRNIVYDLRFYGLVSDTTKHSNSWKGGKMMDGKYVQIYNPGHPQSTNYGYVLEHRLVVEKYLLACLLPWILIHHRNAITNDNRIENLAIMTRKVHNGIHLRKDMSKRECVICRRSKTFVDSKGYVVWHRHPITKEEWICHNCDRKIKRHL